ncbi:MAG: MgtC/SapB family protein [Patescibacteria group bacterium]|nr:MgtC/SapB family protein [Patescibacteria group bacterium]
MLTLEDMILRLVAAVLFGAVVGLERELAGKEAGIRTDIMVASGAAIFSIVGISLPYIIADTPENIPEILARNSGFLGAVANVVVGVGFLGAGIIVKQGFHVRGLTTAATVWFVAAVGVLCGIRLIGFAGVSAVGLAFILFILRKFDMYKFVGKEDEHDVDDEESHRR